MCSMACFWLASMTQLSAALVDGVLAPPEPRDAEPRAQVIGDANLFAAVRHSATARSTTSRAVDAWPTGFPRSQSCDGRREYVVIVRSDVLRIAGMPRFALHLVLRLSTSQPRRAGQKYRRVLAACLHEARTAGFGSAL